MSWRFAAKSSAQLRHSGICHSNRTWLSGSMNTSGSPFPSVQKAMFTPSLVFAY